MNNPVFGELLPCFCVVEQDFRVAVIFGNVNGDHLRLCGRNVFAHKIGANGQLAVTAVAKDGESDRGGTSVAEHTFDGGACGSARVDHVIDEDDVFAVQLCGNVSVGGFGQFDGFCQVIAVEGDVDVTYRYTDALKSFDVGGDHVSKRKSAAAHADKDDVVGAAITFDDLVRDTRNGALYGGFVHYFGFVLHRTPP